MLYLYIEASLKVVISFSAVFYGWQAGAHIESKNFYLC